MHGVAATASSGLGRLLVGVSAQIWQLVIDAIRCVLGGTWIL
ncbi:MAG: hypothetical protein ABI298_00620 [Acidimicrobiales bacterium]